MELNKDMKQNFSARLKQLRLDRNLTQTQLASETGISQSAINKWELGQRKITQEYIIILCKYFNVSADYLLRIIDFE